MTRIYYKGQFFHYPLRPMDALSKLGLFEAFRCMLSFIKAQILPADSKAGGTFEGWVVSRFGRRLFEIFFKTYSEKLWGISCRDLDSDFAAQRIKSLSLLGAVINALKQGRGNKHKTLVDQFLYPKSGSGAVYESMAQHIIASGGIIHSRTKVAKVQSLEKNRQKVVLEDGKTLEGDHVISTMPLTHLVAGLPNVPASVKEAAGALKFRNTVLVYLLIEGKDLFPDNWLYIHDPSLRLGRVTNFRNWVPSLYGQDDRTILCLEYWCNDEDPEWSFKKEDWQSLASQEIIKTGLIKGAKISECFVHHVKRCYPVYKTGYTKEVGQVAEYLKTLPGLTVIGRYGSFKYNNQDHSILMGLLAAQNIAKNAGHDLWSINTDYESYQEDGEADGAPQERQVDQMRVA